VSLLDNFQFCGLYRLTAKKPVMMMMMMMTGVVDSVHMRMPIVISVWKTTLSGSVIYCIADSDVTTSWRRRNVYTAIVVIALTCILVLCYCQVYKVNASDTFHLLSVIHISNCSVLHLE